MSRRKFLLRSAEIGLGLAAVGIAAGGILAQQRPRPWDPGLSPPGRRKVAILQAAATTAISSRW